MTTENQYYFQHKNLITVMIKSLNIHEGWWMLSLQFGLIATNVSEGESGSETIPAAITSVNTIGIQRTTDANNAAVNAAEVNPA